MACTYQLGEMVLHADATHDSTQEVRRPLELARTRTSLLSGRNARAATIWCWISSVTGRWLDAVITIVVCRLLLIVYLHHDEGILLPRPLRLHGWEE